MLVTGDSVSVVYIYIYSQQKVKYLFKSNMKLVRVIEVRKIVREAVIA